MLMADFGSKLDIEPWVQSFGKQVQVGVDVIFSPDQLKGFGVTAGTYSNPGTSRLGVSYTVPGYGKVLGGGQVRLVRATGGLTQSVIYYNFNLNDKLYIQPWLIPAQGGSSWLLGLGYTFKK